MGDRVINGRGLSPGEVEGEAEVCDQFISPLGEISKEGIVASGPCSGLKLSKKILVFKGGRGSTVGSYVFLDLKSRNLAPSGIINENAELMIVTGAIISDIPMVDSVPIDIFMRGDKVRINGKTGEILIGNIKEKSTATVYLVNDDKLLLLKRSGKVSTFPSQYGGISGYVERGELPEQTGKREVIEETGISDVHFVSKGRNVYVRKDDTLFMITPMLMRTGTRGVKLNWENSDYEWISFDSLEKYDTVPKFAETFHFLRDIIF